MVLALVQGDTRLNLTRENFTHIVEVWFGGDPFGSLAYEITFSH